jgi:CheY-like chemotaxis protein
MKMDERADRAGATVLVVDDDEDVRAVAVEALSQGGFDVLEAGDGEAALAMIQDHPDIELVVTDVVMPGISGIHVARGAKRHDKKVVMTSAYSSALVEGSMPADRFLAKPYRLGELRRAVGGLLDR